MSRVARSPVRGTFDACDTVVEIDWHRGDEQDTTLGVIVGHLPDQISSPAAVLVDRVFDDDDPEQVAIPYENIDEIRTGPEADDVEQVVWTRKPARQWVKVVCQGELALSNEGEELELGPFSQGVVVDCGTIRDVATNKVIAVFEHYTRSTGERWYVPPAQTGADGTWFRRIFIQPC